jgi:hypothetical protein
LCHSQFYLFLSKYKTILHDNCRLTTICCTIMKASLSLPFIFSHLQFFRHCFLLLHVMKSPDPAPCLTSTPKNRRSLSAIYTRQTTVECYEVVFSSVLL